MTRKKNFGSPVEDLEPLSFTIFDEEFQCRPQLQGATLLTYSKRLASDNLSEVNEAFLNFFESSLKQESYKRFKALIESEDRIVQIETLGEIAEWLIEEYTDRPTPESKGS